VHEGVLARIDVLARTGPDRFVLCEVKSATQIRDEHLDDVALQLWVARGAGIDVERVEIAFLDASYVRGPEGIDLRALFVRRNGTGEARLLAEDVPAQVARSRQVLEQSTPPAIEPSPHCRRPQPCEFFDDCRRGQPEDSIERLPALRESTYHELRRAGIARICEIPDDFPLARAQARARRAHRERGLVVARDLASRLAAFGPPSDYLDFEAIGPALPLFAGTSPYESIPFQWSLHGVDEHGEVEHREFLATGREDPRPEFAASLLDALGASDRPIVVYSSFEARVLDALAVALPEHVSALAAIRARLRDLYGVIRHSVYHPRFAGSFSLKKVAPGLAPDFGYGDLDEVANGSDAAHAFERIVRGEVDAEEEAEVRASLLRYCSRDTEALVRAHLALVAHLSSVRERT
jgi:predicted RecB family nuclease